MKPMIVKKRFLAVLLALVVFLIGPSSGFPSGNASTKHAVKYKASSSGGDKVLLSIRIAKARKTTRGIRFYRSIARQQKFRRPATARPPSSAR